MSTAFITGIIFLIAFFFFCIAIYVAIKKNSWQLSVFLILLLGLGLRLFISTDCFLHDWDERFHAVVAKNTIAHPLRPTLYDNPVLAYDYKNWTGNHIWLSKPSLPFWCMGVSIVVFGANEFGLRFPSILFSLLSVFLTIKIGRLLFNKRVGLIAGFFHTIHGLWLELTGGLVSSDHVEILFLTVIQLGILCTIQYVKNEKIYLLFLIGLLMGLAFLCKWILCLFLFFIWVTIRFWEDKNVLKLIRDSLIIGLAFLLVVSPWLYYITQAFPIESEWIFRELIMPVQTSIQGHEGNAFFYVDRIRILFGELIYILLIWLVVKLWAKERPNLRILFFWIMIPMVLLSISGTKRYTYIMIAAPAFFILTAFFIVYWSKIMERLIINKGVLNLFLILLIALPIRYSIERIKPFKERMVYPEWRISLESFKRTLGAETKQVLLSNEPHYLDAMFYYDLLAYPSALDATQLEEVKIKGYRVFEQQGGKYKER